MTRHIAARLLALVVAATPAAAQTAPAAKGSDFQPNDQILLEVEGDTQFTHTFTVAPGPALVLPVIGAIPLAGVHRGDVEAYLTQQLKRYIKDPVVHAKALVRLAVLGEVARPGFYPVPAEGLVSDLLMAAGGPTQNAKVGSMRIEREGRSVWSGDGLQDAIARGATVDGMGLHAGDRIIVPRRGDAESTVRMIGILAGIPAAILILTHLH